VSRLKVRSKDAQAVKTSKEIGSSSTHIALQISVALHYGRILIMILYHCFKEGVEIIERRVRQWKDEDVVRSRQ
jgi:hypothetical protein